MATDYTATISAIQQYIGKKLDELKVVRDRYQEVCAIADVGKVLEDVELTATVKTKVGEKKLALEQWIEAAASQAGIELVKKQT